MLGIVWAQHGLSGPRPEAKQCAGKPLGGEEGGAAPAQRKKLPARRKKEKWEEEEGETARREGPRRQCGAGAEGGEEEGEGCRINDDRLEWVNSRL